jgi:DNA-binding transcriptional LysR family regulator
VSAQVRQLEHALGQELLDRSGRAGRLTEAGTAVLPFARAALGAMRGVRLAVDEISGLMRGHVVVGMVVQCAQRCAAAWRSPGGPRPRPARRPAP